MCSTSASAPGPRVMLHLVNRAILNIPVVLIDTGYLFPETYHGSKDDLVIDKQVLCSESVPLRRLAGLAEILLLKALGSGTRRRDELNTIASISRSPWIALGLRELGAETWFAGLRRVQAETRAQIAPIEFKRGRYKVHPLFDWTDRDVARYLEAHRLPHHPLWEKGYLSIGDWHTTRSKHSGDSMEEPRFFGLARVVAARVALLERLARDECPAQATKRRSLTNASMIAMSVLVSRGGRRIVARVAKITPGIDPTSRQASTRRST